ncbi:hypothetical protein GCM10009854_13960 [Saccharopolyspora halophila]|uniref:Zinc-finger n=1 Tax=Saccharopolyspora halophila TaxID=405551 RepID=A0ABN3FW01_9PSEU
MFEYFGARQVVAYWRPCGGFRHALPPDEPPRPGRERETLCGLSVEIGCPTEIDWLSPTCEPCWTAAIDRRDAAHVE